MDGYLLGIDHGGSVSKVALFDTEGHEIAVTFRYVDLIQPSQGWSERDANQMWADTWGLQNLQPGTVVLVMFPAGLGNIADYQYNGLWMVERVLHNFGGSYYTRMLLTRNGMDTSQYTSLLPATDKAASIPTFIFPALGRVPIFSGTIGDQSA